MSKLSKLDLYAKTDVDAKLEAMFDVQCTSPIVEEFKGVKGQHQVPGRPLPLEAAISYLMDVQHRSSFFRGFSFDDLRIVFNSFEVVDVPRGKALVTGGERAEYCCALLRGTADVYRPGIHGAAESIAHFREGDFVAPDKMFEGNIECINPFDQTVTTSAPFNVVMVITKASLMELNITQPNIGMRMLRVAGEACTLSIFCPMRGEKMPTVLEEDEKLKTNVRKALEDLPKRVLVEDLTDTDVDYILTMSTMVTFEKGEKIFSAGDQSNHVMMLLFGQLEIRKGFSVISTVGSAGEVMGECLFPFVSHMNDLYASTRATLLSFSVATLQQMNEERPQVGFCIVRNIIRSSLGKMKIMFSSKLTNHDSEMKTLTISNDFVKEMQSLQFMLDDAVPRLLYRAHMAQSLCAKQLGNLGTESPCTVKEDCPVLDNADAVVELAANLEDLCKMQEHLGVAIRNKTIMKANFHRVQDKNMDLTEEVGRLNEEIKSKLKDIQAVEAEVTKRDNHIAKLTAELNDRDKKIDSLDEEIEEVLVKSREEGKQLRLKLRDAEKMVHQLMQKQAQAEGKGGGGGGDSENAGVWHTIIKEQQVNLDLREKEAVTLREENHKLQAQVDTLRREVVGLREAIAVQLNENQAKEDEEDEEEEEDEEMVDETVPRMMKEISELRKVISRMRWGFLARKMVQRKEKGNVFLDIIMQRRKCRELKAKHDALEQIMGSDEERRKAELADVRKMLESKAFVLDRSDTAEGGGDVEDMKKRLIQVTELPEIKELQALLQQTENRCTAAEEQIQAMDFELQETLDNTEICIQDMEAVSSLSYLLVMRLIDIENHMGRWDWTPQDVLTVRRCWNLMRKRGSLSPEAMQLDVENKLLHSDEKHARPSQVPTSKFKTHLPVRKARISAPESAFNLEEPLFTSGPQHHQGPQPPGGNARRMPRHSAHLQPTSRLSKSTTFAPGETKQPRTSQTLTHSASMGISPRRTFHESAGMHKAAAQDFGSGGPVEGRQKQMRRSMSDVDCSSDEGGAVRPTSPPRDDKPASLSPPKQLKQRIRITREGEKERHKQINITGRPVTPAAEPKPVAKLNPTPVLNPVPPPMNKTVGSPEMPSKSSEEMHLEHQALLAASNARKQRMSEPVLVPDALNRFKSDFDELTVRPGSAVTRKGSPRS